MVNHNRDLPPVVRGLGNFQNINLNQGDMNYLVGTFRNSWTPTIATGSPLLNGSLSVGGNDPILFGHRIGYLFSGTVSSGTDLKDGQVRALADRGTTKGETVEIDRFTGSTTSQSVLWGGLTNLSTLINEGSRISFNGLFNRSADNEARVESGTFAADAIPVQITRMQYTERGVYSGQLTGEHQIGSAHRLDWSATSSGVRRYEPDRSAFVQIDRARHAGRTRGAPLVQRRQRQRRAHATPISTRTATSTRAKYTLTFGTAGSPTTIKVGGLSRHTSRDAQSLSYAISARNLTPEQLALPLEQIFDGRFSTPDVDSTSTSDRCRRADRTPRTTD